MKKTIYKVICLDFCLLLTNQTWSQPDINHITDTIQTPEVVITGTHIKLNKDKLPLSVTVIDRHTLEESGSSSVFSALNGLVPGLFITERGISGFGVSQGAAGQISLRGIGGSPTTGVLVLIDGHPQYMGLFGHPLADMALTSQVEQVEVIRGPASVLYGTNAMGGVINLVSRRPDRDINQFRLSYGSWDSRLMEFSTTRRTEKLTVFGTLHADHTDGHRPHADFTQQNGQIAFSWQLTDHFKAGLHSQAARYEGADPGPDTLGALPGKSYRIERGYGALSVDNAFAGWSGSLSLFLEGGKHRFSDGFRSTDQLVGLKGYESVRLWTNGTLTMGVDYSRYGGNARQVSTNSPTRLLVDTAVTETGYYGLFQQSFFNKLSLQAGFRWNHHSIYGDIPVPSGGLAWNLLPETTWKISCGKGFRSPVIRELFLWNHNAALQPERVMNYETSWNYNLPSHKLSMELTAYATEGSNLIVADALGKLYNTGALHHRGLEVAASWKPAAGFSTHLCYNYLHMKQPAYATPRQQIALQLGYTRRTFRLVTSVRYIDQLNTVANPLAAPAFQHYLLWNQRVSGQLSRTVNWYVQADNLLNQSYETIRYYPMPGFSWHTGLSLEFH